MAILSPITSKTMQLYRFDDRNWIGEIIPSHGRKLALAWEIVIVLLLTAPEYIIYSGVN